MRRHPRLPAGLVGVLVVVGAACGGGSTTATSSSTTRLGPAAAPSEVPLTRVGPTFAVLCAGPIPTVAPGTVSVPGVVGIDVQDAVDHTVCAGLHYRLHPSDPSTTGIVFAQVPAAGAEVSLGTTVTLDVRSPSGSG